MPLSHKVLGCAALLCYLAPGLNAQFQQQGPILFGSGASNSSGQGFALALSADGNTAIIGGYEDNNLTGAAWVFTRAGGVWSQQGGKLVGTGATGPAQQGLSVALSADGNTALVGGTADNNYAGATWVFTRSVGVWSQQGTKLVGSSTTASPYAAGSVALSADGNTALIGSLTTGAWVFTRSGGVWSQQGQISPPANSLYFGRGVALSADGNTALVSSEDPTDYVGEAWVFRRSGNLWVQQGGKLRPADATPILSNETNFVAIALSADGNTAAIGWPSDNGLFGAAWVFTQAGGTWSQQGGKLIGNGAIPDSYGRLLLGSSVSLSGDGNTLMVSAPADNAWNGANWVFERSGESWSQSGGKLVGQGPCNSGQSPCDQGVAVVLSADGSTALFGTSGVGAFVFTSEKPSNTTLTSSLNPSVFGQTVTFTATVATAATGTVIFRIDGVAQAAVVLSSGQAHYAISTLPPGNHAIDAEYGGDAAFAGSTSNTVNQTVNPLGAILPWANTVVSLGQSTRLPLSLAKPAPYGGVTVYLASSDPSKVTVTPSLFIAAGKTAPSVQASVNGVNLGAVTITATALGYTPGTASVAVTASLAFARCCLTIVRGTSQSAVLSLSAPAPSGGLTVQLYSDNPKAATVPASVTFAPHAASVNVPITGESAGTASIHASGLPNLADVSIKITVH
ncbi:MAG TPA: Ig-like domain-containing protein [Bryobacteraceae bacterium]|nr:Ig-like domain-containing protein [Bryobacteraceae bacterium]